MREPSHDEAKEELLVDLRVRVRVSVEVEREPRPPRAAGSRASLLREPTPGALRSEPLRYGREDREDLFRLHQPPPHADAVAAIFDRARVSDSRDGTSTLRTIAARVRFGLGPEEPFAAQPSGASATGFLVSPRVIATAAHCVEEIELSHIRFVFGFRMVDAATAQLVVPNHDVYSAARILALRHDPQGADWALVELDRDVAGRKPAPIRRSGRVGDGAKLYVLGHPCGLPLKYADNALVRDNQPAPFFVANLDTYVGNSGSPVFNAETNEVEGVLSRGGRDFMLAEEGYVSMVFPDSGGRGEDCTRTTEFAALVPG
ncbi:serine protease [Sorangium sp. So ce134]